MDELQRAKRSATIAGVVIGLLAVLLALMDIGLMVGLGVLAVVVGIAFTLTVLGAIVGVPLMIAGALCFVGGILGSGPAVFYGLLAGAGGGWTFYRLRLRALTRPPG